MKQHVARIATVLALSAHGMGFALGGTLEDVQSRDQLRCSAHTANYFGFAELTDTGEWQGFDIDLCKALATAVLGDPTKVNFVPVGWEQRFPALQSGELDVVFKRTTWTLSRNTELGLTFTIPYFFSSVQIAVPANSGINAPVELAGATGCGLQGSSTEQVLVNYFASIGAQYNAITYQSSEEMSAAYFADRCDYMAASDMTLATTLKDQLDKHKILPELLDLHGNSGVVRQGDDSWFNVVNWTVNAIITAEAMGITSENVDQKADSVGSNIEVARFLGVAPGVGAKLGLRDGWVRDVIRAVGNYGEIYRRNVGDGSPYKLARGKNQHWSSGGLLVGPVFD